MKPVRQTGDATGGPERPLEKPMDKPPKQYTVNESVPQDSFHEGPCPNPDAPSSHDRSKRFM